MSNTTSPNTSLAAPCTSLPATPPKTTKPNAAQNENIITINVPYSQQPNECQTSTSSIALSPQPFRLDINKSTDWPTIIIGLSGILSSIIIARYTSKIQSNQIKSNIANLRHRWIEEFRETASTFMEKATYIYNMQSENEKYLLDPVSTEIYSSMLSSQIKLTIMLDPQHERNRRAVELSERIINAVKIQSTQARDLAMSEYGREFEGLVRDILESAWQDIKRDLSARNQYNPFSQEPKLTTCITLRSSGTVKMLRILPAP